jgi:hypothetical protein
MHCDNFFLVASSPLLPFSFVGFLNLSTPVTTLHYTNLNHTSTLQAAVSYSLRLDLACRCEESFLGMTRC